MATTALCLLSFLASLHLAHGPASDSFEMREIGRVPYFPWERYVCGDADHDGRQEFYAMGRRRVGGDWTNFILEHVGGAKFDTFPLGFIQATTWDIGDADQDGRTDLLLESRDSLNNPVYLVLESADSASLPLTPVWAETLSPGSGHDGRITDIDADSAREVALYAVREGYACAEFYECVGPDRYDLMTRALLYEPGPTDFIQTPDLDRDGLPELACGSLVGLVYFLESVADDSLVVKDIVRIGDSYHVVTSVEAAPDMDRDGKPEVIALGVDDVPCLCTLAVIESPGDDSFEIVWSTQLFPGGRAYGNSLSVGDMDGDGVPEFSVGDGSFIRLFRCTGDNQYEEFWKTPTRWGTAALYDINSDGKAELLYHLQDSTNWTVICEYFSLGIEERRLRQLERVFVSPSAVAGGKGVRISGLGVSASVEVVDACGRIVTALVERRNGEAVWSTGSVQPGAYFIRASLGAQSVTRKVIVLR